MNLTDLQAVTNIIVHANCADGLASAILLHDALPNAKIQFVQYGTSEYQQLQPAPGMLFCDFSPLAQKADDFAKAGTIILDHHKGAKKVVSLFGDRGVFGDEVTEPGVCGAVLAYRHVWLPVMAQQKESPEFQALLKKHATADDELATYMAFVERFATLAGIRDTWQNKSPLWKAGCEQVETLNMMPNERWLEMTLHEIASEWKTRFSWIGEVLWEKHMKGIAKAIKGGHRFTTEQGTRVIVFEGVRKTSDGAELLDQEVDLIIGFNMFEEDALRKMTNCPFHNDSNPSLKLEDDGTYFCFGCQAKGKTADHPEIQTTRRAVKMIFSSRSHTNFDCLSLAKAFGGGGHTKAAGFNREMNVNDPNPYAMIEAMITMYEAEQARAKAQTEASAAAAP